MYASPSLSRFVSFIFLMKIILNNNPLLKKKLFELSIAKLNYCAVRLLLQLACIRGMFWMLWFCWFQAAISVVWFVATYFSWHGPYVESRAFHCSPFLLFKGNLWIFEVEIENVRVQQIIAWMSSGLWAWCAYRYTFYGSELWLKPKNILDRKMKHWIYLGSLHKLTVSSIRNMTACLWVWLMYVFAVPVLFQQRAALPYIRWASISLWAKERKTLWLKFPEWE